jgi:hypothetical protein
LAAAQKQLDEVTGFVKVELQKLGYDVTLDVAKNENNPDAMFLRFDRFNVRASFITYGANKGRIDWQGYAHSRENHISERPRMGDTTSAADAPAKRIAKAIASRIIEPAKPDLDRYMAMCDRWDTYRAKLPAQVAMVNALGFECQSGPGATEAGFYLSRGGVSGNAMINGDGNVSFTRLSLDPETARCVLEFLAARPKGK